MQSAGVTRELVLILSSFCHDPGSDLAEILARCVLCSLCLADLLKQFLGFLVFVIRRMSGFFHADSFPRVGPIDYPLPDLKPPKTHSHTGRRTHSRWLSGPAALEDANAREQTQADVKLTDEQRQADPQFGSCPFSPLFALRRKRLGQFPKWFVLTSLHFPFGLSYLWPSKGGTMGGQPLSEISCILCSKPVDLRTDLTADENGKAVHEDCYVQRITNQRDNSPATLIAN